MTVRSFKTLACALILILAPLSPSDAAPDCHRERRVFAEAKRLYESGQNLLSAMQFSPLRFSECGHELTSKSWVGYSFALDRLQESQEALYAVEAGLREPMVAANEKAALAMLKAKLQDAEANELTGDQRLRWRLWSARLDRELFQRTLESSPIEAKEKSKLQKLQMNIESSPRKSPWFAGVASALVPGAGQAYVGHWQAAGLAFVINAAFLAATLEFARKDMPAATIAGAGVLSITYIGNILSSVEGANAANRMARAGAENDAKMILLPELTF